MCVGCESLSCGVSIAFMAIPFFYGGPHRLGPQQLLCVCVCVCVLGTHKTELFFLSRVFNYQRLRLKKFLQQIITSRRKPRHDPYCSLFRERPPLEWRLLGRADEICGSAVSAREPRS